MDYEIYSKIKKGNRTILRSLEVSELPWAYFVCYRITQNTETAAELLRDAWKETLSVIVSLGGCPKASFRSCLARKIYYRSEAPLESDHLFSSFEIPKLPDRFDGFVNEIDRLETKEKKIYLLNKLGELDSSAVADILDLSLQEAKAYLDLLKTKAHPQNSKQAFLDLVALSNEFKGSNKHLFEAITIPSPFLGALEHDYTSVFHNTNRKDSPKMKPNTQTGNQNTKKTEKQSPKRRKSFSLPLRQFW